MEEIIRYHHNNQLNYKTLSLNGMWQYIYQEWSEKGLRQHIDVSKNHLDHGARIRFNYK